jgi:hypothetical protein
MRKEQGGRERSPAPVPLLLFPASRVTSQGQNIKSLENLDGVWLRVGDASLLDPSHLMLSLEICANSLLTVNPFKSCFQGGTPFPSQTCQDQGRENRSWTRSLRAATIGCPVHSPGQDTTRSVRVMDPCPPPHVRRGWGDQRGNFNFLTKLFFTSYRRPCVYIWDLNIPGCYIS